MNRLETALLHLTTLVLTITGLVYVYMHYFMKPTDVFSVVGHPWEPAVLKTHILVAPALILVVGLIAHSHILFKLSVNTQVGKRSGLFLIPLFLIMVSSGYVLQIVTEGRKMLMIVHLISGILWFLSYVSHQVSAYVIKRAMAERAVERRQIQNGSAF